MRPCTKLSGTVVQLNRSCTKRFRFACWKVRYSILETCDPPVTPHGAALCLWNSACQPFSHASAGDSAAVQTQRRREHMVTRRDVFFHARVWVAVHASVRVQLGSSTSAARHGCYFHVGRSKTGFSKHVHVPSFRMGQSFFYYHMPVFEPVISRVTAQQFKISSEVNRL